MNGLCFAKQDQGSEETFKGVYFTLFFSEFRGALGAKNILDVRFQGAILRDGYVTCKMLFFTWRHAVQHSYFLVECFSQSYT